MGSPIEPSLDAEIIRGWAAVQRARARRAADKAGRHERLLAAAGSEQRAEFHARMAALHRLIELRHHTSARLHEQYAARIGTWAALGSLADATPRLMGIVAADLGAHSVGIMLLGPNRSMASAIASDSLAADAQAVEFDLDEGPMHEVARHGRPVLAGLDAADGRWPHYSAAMERLGVRSVAAVPLREAATCLGALTAFDTGPAGRSSGLIDRLTTMADALTYTMLLAGDNVGADDGPAGLLLRDQDQRVVTHQAVGMVAAQCNCSVEDALALIKARAFALDQRVDTIAHRIVNRTLRFDDQPKDRRS